jgi:DNA-binding NarL/FixJ family response regulator
VSAPVSVLLGDDSPVFLAAAATIVAATPGFELAGACSSVGQAVETAADLQPDLALLDESMLGADPARTAQAVRAASPRTFVVLISADPRPAGELPIVDKRSLSPALLADLWRQRPTGGADAEEAA